RRRSPGADRGLPRALDLSRLRHGLAQGARMKLLTAAAGSLFVLASPSARPEEATAELTQGSQTMIITRSGSQPSSTGSAQYFTGSVRIDPLFKSKKSGRAMLSGARRVRSTGMEPQQPQA